MTDRPQLTNSAPEHPGPQAQEQPQPQPPPQPSMQLRIGSDAASQRVLIDLGNGSTLQLTPDQATNIADILRQKVFEVRGIVIPGETGRPPGGRLIL